MVDDDSSDEGSSDDSDSDSEDDLLFGKKLVFVVEEISFKVWSIDVSNGVVV